MTIRFVTGMLLFVLIGCRCSFLLAETMLPTVPALLQNMQVYHPYINVLDEKNTQFTYGLEGAKSAFDPTIEQDVSSRVSGYYDGSYAAQRFIQPLGEMNALLISEYRIASGDFPVYEGKYNTLSAGEASIGVALSLLKNRSTDERRTGVANAKLSLLRYQAELELKMNDFLYKGISHYLAWYEASLKVVAVKSLITTLEERRDGLRARLKRGDLAEVTLTEFEASLMEQRLALTKIKQTQLSTAQSLAYYWRNENGNPLVIDPAATIPNNIHWPYLLSTTNSTNLRRAIHSHPLLAMLRAEQQVIKNDYRLAESQLLPKLDLKALVAKDMGSGPKSLAETEGKVGLSFSYTLGNRKAKAEQGKLQSKLKVLEYEYQLAQDQITQQFEQAYAYWQQAGDVLSLQQQNSALAIQLSALERKRFDAGDSDMFTLNARESGVLNAKLKEIEAQIDLLHSEVKLHWAAATVLKESHDDNSLVSNGASLIR